MIEISFDAQLWRKIENWKLKEKFVYPEFDIFHSKFHNCDLIFYIYPNSANKTRKQLLGNLNDF